MTIVGDRKFVEVPGGKTHELPPLLVRTVPDVKRLDKMMGIASEIIEQEDMVPSVPCDAIADEEIVERRKMDLALNLVDQYLGFGSARSHSARDSNCGICCAATFGRMRAEAASLPFSETKQWRSKESNSQKRLDCGLRFDRCRPFAAVRTSSCFI